MPDSQWTFLAIVRISILSLVVQGCAITTGQYRLEQEICSSNHCVEMTARAPYWDYEYLFDKSSRKDGAKTVTWRLEFSTVMPADSIRVDSVELRDSVYSRDVLRIYAASTNPARLAIEMRDPYGRLGVQEELRIHGMTYFTGGETCPLEETRQVNLRFERSPGIVFHGH